MQEQSGKRESGKRETAESCNDVFEQEATERTEGKINRRWTRMDTDLGKAERWRQEDNLKDQCASNLGGRSSPEAQREKSRRRVWYGSVRLQGGKYTPPAP